MELILKYFIFVGVVLIEYLGYLKEFSTKIKDNIIFTCDSVSSRVLMITKQKLSLLTFKFK